MENSPGGSWDQFAANEKLFGLKTDFDEEIYTTTLNRSAPGYKDREKRAIKMANEIQKVKENAIWFAFANLSKYRLHQLMCT